MPKGYEHPDEARLERFGRTVTSLPDIWDELAEWWLVKRAGANTPNWDLALECEIEGRGGLVLVEAKANERELSSAGKPAAKHASANSRANHARIGVAISEASAALQVKFPETRLAINAHYQLANRMAFAWKLANLGIPTVLIYLGFTGDAGIADAGVPFRDHQHWHDHFSAHLAQVAPITMAEQRIDCGAAPFWLLTRSRNVLEQSPARTPRTT